MLKFTKKGIEYNGKLYKISAADQKFIKDQNKQRPDLHPARDLQSLSITVTELD